MNDKRILSIVLLLACVQLGCQPLSDHANNLDFATESKIDAILATMTLEEKAGQMSQVSRFGEDGPGDIENEVRKGNVGSFLNIAEIELRNKLQKIAVEESRLGIPLIFGYDVIHGHRTVFPVPLGEAASWNLDLMERTACISAKEARAVGIDWTFSPMIDIGVPLFSVPAGARNPSFSGHPVSPREYATNSRFQTSRFAADHISQVHQTDPRCRHCEDHPIVQQSLSQLG